MHVGEILVLNSLVQKSQVCSELGDILEHLSAALSHLVLVIWILGCAAIRILTVY